MSEQKLSGLEDLPEFETNPFSHGGIRVHEIARLTYKESPQTHPPYRRQKTVAVMGRSPDSETIYFSEEDVLARLDGQFWAFGNGGGAGNISNDVTREQLERYEVLIPNEKLGKVYPTRELC